MARIQEAIDECTLKASTEVLAALTFTAEATEERAIAAPAASRDSDEIAMEKPEEVSKQLEEFNALFQKWFALIFDALRSRRSTAVLNYKAQM